MSNTTFLSRPLEAPLAAPSAGPSLPVESESRTVATAARLRRVNGVCRTRGAYPKLQLRGDRAYLRALRAAELTAWEAGEPVNPPSRPTD